MSKVIFISQPMGGRSDDEINAERRRVIEIARQQFGKVDALETFFTGYFGMDTMNKALIATNIQADATMDVICANGRRIQQAWEDSAEDSEV